MGISSIQSVQPGLGSWEIYRSRGRTGTEVQEESSNRNTGPDTVNFSAQALELAGLSAAVEAANSAGETESTAAIAESAGDSENNKASSSADSLKGQGMSLFEMMLQHLLLAELESAEEKKRASQQSASQQDSFAGSGESQSRSSLEDNDTIRELKKLMRDLMNGKADLADLPKAMALVSSGASRFTSGVASQASAGADTENTAAAPA